MSNVAHHHLGLSGCAGETLRELLKTRSFRDPRWSRNSAPWHQPAWKSSLLKRRRAWKGLFAAWEIVTPRPSAVFM